MSKREAQKEQLKEMRKAILRANQVYDLMKSINSLEKAIEAMMANEENPAYIQEMLNHTQETIQKFRMHDTTRWEVCRWVQTLICEM